MLAESVAYQRIRLKSGFGDLPPVASGHFDISSEPLTDTERTRSLMGKVCKESSIFEGAWGKVSDEGFVVRLDPLDATAFYGQFKYTEDSNFHGTRENYRFPDGSTLGWICHCNTIAHGWNLRGEGDVSRTLRPRTLARPPEAVRGKM